jgi:hypothetical protein
MLVEVGNCGHRRSGTWGRVSSILDKDVGLCRGEGGEGLYTPVSGLRDFMKPRKVDFESTCTGGLAPRLGKNVEGSESILW